MMMSRLIVTGAVLASALTLSGCAAVAPASTEPTEATCQNMVPADVQTDLDNAGLTPRDVESTYADSDRPFARMVGYGGILCEQSAPNGERLIYGYGPLTAAQAMAEGAALKKIEDGGSINGKGGQVYDIPPESHLGGNEYQVYVISPAGYWAFSSGNYLDIRDMIPELPAFY